MWAFIQQHLFWTGVIGYWLFSAIVGAAPEPDSSSGKGYVFLYRFIHLIGGNLKNAFGSKVPGQQAGTGG